MIELRKTEEISLDFKEEIEKSKKGFWGFVYDWVDTLMFAVILILLLFTFFVRPVVVDGNSMNPTLKNGDVLTVRSVNTKIQKGDIVVTQNPLEKPLVKRVIATGGDTIDFDFMDGVVIVNGVALNEPYIAEATHLMGNMVYPQTVPEGKIFVMGDNRNDSRDSRDKSIGFIDEREVIGVVNFRLYPFSSLGGVS